MEITTLRENGVPIYSYKNNNVHSFALILCVKFGVLFENEKENGLAHLLEHTVFRNLNSLLNGTLNAYLDLNGLYFNATTYKNYIEFKITGSKRNFSKAASLICKVLSPIDISAKDFETEKKRIKAEIFEDGGELISDLADKIIFENTSLERTICGKIPDINRYKITEIKKIFPQIITKENLFFYIAGNFPDNAPDLISDNLENYNLLSGSERKNIAEIPKNFGKRNCKIFVKDGTQTSVSINFDAFNKDFSIPEFYLLYDIIFSGENSLMYLELSEKYGTVYSFEPYLANFENISVMGLNYDVRADKLEKSIEIALSVFEKIKTEVKERLPYVLPIYKDNIYSLIDDPLEFASTFLYENHILNCRFPSVEARRQAFSKVKAETLINLANKIFTLENLVIVIKSSKTINDLNKIKNIAEKALNERN